jgi:hypothetical protein
LSACRLPPPKRRMSPWCRHCGSSSTPLFAMNATSLINLTGRGEYARSAGRVTHVRIAATHVKEDVLRMRSWREPPTS